MAKEVSMGKLCISMHLITLSTLYITFMLVAHTCIFMIDHVK
jgi:hypothetical protein